MIKRRKGRRSIPQSWNDRVQGHQTDGFGIVEAITAAAILAGIIVTTLTISGMIDEAKYQASTRDAIRQAIDTDIEEVKQHLFEYQYVAPTYSGNTVATNACYKTHTSCSGASSITNLVQTCRLIGSGVSTQLGGNSAPLNLDRSTHAVFTNAPVVINRTITPTQPSTSSGNGITTDQSVLRVTYSVAGVSSAVARAGLLSDSRGEVLRTVTLYPDAHAYCNPE